MRFDDEVTINAGIDAVWAIYSDIEHWPEWTESVRRVRYVDGNALAAGARVRIEQPKLAAAVWTVESVEPGRSWTWFAKKPGITTTAVHTLEPAATNTTRVRQTIEFGGPVGAIAARLYARLTRAYLAMEAAGLKRRCESITSK